MAEIKSSDIPVLPWPAVPTPTPDEVYKGLSEQAREYPTWLEANVHWRDVGKKPEKLSRLRVLDVTMKSMGGHWCTSLFAEHGAEVIMVEPPGGDPTRRLTPFNRQQWMFKDSVTGEAGFEEGANSEIGREGLLALARQGGDRGGRQLRVVGVVQDEGHNQQRGL
jgi:hypothetical protein